MNRAAANLRSLGRLLGALTLAAWLLALAACTTAPRPPAGTLTAPVAVPAQVMGNLFFVELRQADGRTRRFLVDTGSSANYVSSDAAKALALREREERTVVIESAQGKSLTLPAVTLRSLQIGALTFERVPAAVFDFTDLSSHLGITIDGLLGFPLFRDHLLTLDYPRTQLVVAPLPAAPAALTSGDPRVSTLAFSNEQKVPFIPVQMGNESFVVLLDSGSDAALCLNPAGLHPRFTFGPRVGTVVTTVTGSDEQLVGRLKQDLLVGDHTIATPVTDLTAHVSALGGEVLRHFALTFDQRRNRVTLAREADGVVVLAPRRTTGLALARSPIYWRVLSVVPDTPATQLGVQPGELIVRINGEPVEKWDYARYTALVAGATQVTFTFLAGTKEFDREVPVFELVP